MQDQHTDNKTTLRRSTENADTPEESRAQEASRAVVAELTTRGDTTSRDKKTINVHGIHTQAPFAARENYLNYEQSWLDFNWRVLREATDPERNPLLDRIKFLAITGTNLDEFFQKRVGGLKRQLFARVTTASVDGLLPEEQLHNIRTDAQRMMHAMGRVWLDDLMPSLHKIGIRIKRLDELNAAERSWIDRYFAEMLFPILTPLAVDPGHPFPFISNLSLSLGAELKDRQGNWRFARIKVPPVRPRLVRIPAHYTDDETVFVPIEQIIRGNIDALFTGMRVMSTALFRVTRNAEVGDTDEDADDLLQLIADELRHRKYAPVVRLELTPGTSPRLTQLLMHELDITHDDIYETRGMIGAADLFALAEASGFSQHRQPKWSPQPHPAIRDAAGESDTPDMFALIRRGDLMVHYPYHSFEQSVVQFVRQASRDPKVLAIKQTLYRTTEDSENLLSLIEAAESGKQVAVLVELKARFDEQRNIELAQRLEKSGVHVTYGLVGLKTHCKTTLVVREEASGIRRYFHIGTGNYNPKTARLYEDLGIFSCDPVIGGDLTRLFNYLTGYAPDQAYQKLLVAPRYLRKRFLQLIDTEIAQAKAGKPARIIWKLNGDDSASLSCFACRRANRFDRTQRLPIAPRATRLEREHPRKINHRSLFGTLAYLRLRARGRPGPLHWFGRHHASQSRPARRGVGPHRPTGVAALHRLHLATVARRRTAKLAHAARRQLHAGVDADGQRLVGP